MKKSAFVLCVISIMALLMLAACGSQPTPAATPPAAQPPAEVPPAPVPNPPAQQPVPPVQQPATPAPSAAQPAAPVQAAAGCDITPTSIMTLCGQDYLPVQQDGCKFVFTANDTYHVGGDVTITRVKGTEADYLKQLDNLYAALETFELKPRSARGEQKPYSTFLWWTGSEIITVKGQTSLCPSDKLKKVAQAIEAGAPVKTADFCGVSKKSACEVDTDCVAAGCSNSICQATTDAQTISTCEFKDCYVAKNYGLSCGCVDKQCTWR